MTDELTHEATVEVLKGKRAMVDRLQAENDKLKAVVAGVKGEAKMFEGLAKRAAAKEAELEKELAGERFQLRAYEAENERLRAIVDKLPKTADGVILTLGVRAFHLSQSGRMHSVLIPEAFVCEHEDCHEVDIGAETLSGWYSIPEAAKAAKEQGT